MEADQQGNVETSSAETGESSATSQDLSDWRGKSLIDRDGEKIGRLEDVYFDLESDEPQFGTFKEGLIKRHLAFVPLIGVTITPDSLQVTATREQIKGAPTLREGDELSPDDESALYHHYQLNYAPTNNTANGRRLVRH